ncbi:hypothetical protein [Marilutibacter chinensis]|uniref:UmuC domain-containing protein n=1 Tax=Marilutibacter chinensis TaxID=2912247 RepID=A0ABS9I0I6_9GAMM|nr:hypothetical protein [Lysobacter chinensis]MCF7223822.1 hypothetical protein [Lysobacter chinensis]
MTLRCLFVDFNSYFASVEQFDAPGALLGRPVAVVPVLAATTCCIAASYEAKAFGIRTGTPVWEALELCPQLEIRQARPARYIEMHHELMAAIEDCIPHDKPLSIDEVPCRLIGRERERGNAEAIARRIKQTLHDRGYSPAIRCSIGIAPNRFLAKTASDMRKPDGLTVIEASDLPDILYSLELRDLCGIGPSMARRLQRAGISTVRQLYEAGRRQLRLAWGSIEGERYWLQLRGHELPAPPTRRGSIGHSHVLDPALRSHEGARAVLFKLLAKAAMRMRHEGFQATGMSVSLRFVGLERRFERHLRFAALDDTPSLLAMLARQLDVLARARERRRWDPRQHPPLSVAVSLTGLEQVEADSHGLLPNRDRSRKLSQALDAINRRYGNNTLYVGAMQAALAHDAAPMRIPFSKIPETALEEDAHARTEHETADELWLQRERQFKVLAEQAHRLAQQRQQPPRAGRSPSGYGTGPSAPPAEEEVSAQGRLF